MRSAKVAVINDDTGEWKVDFYEDEKQCKAFEIDSAKSKIAKQYAAYGHTYEDIILILKWVRDLKKEVEAFEKSRKDIQANKNFGVIEETNKDKNRLFSSFTSISILYGRLFTSNRTRRLSLNPKVIILEKHRHTHDELMKIRHDYIAHSSGKMYEESKTFLIVNPHNQSEFYISYYISRVYFPAVKLLDNVVKHFEDLLVTIESKLNELNDILIKQFEKLNLAELVPGQKI